MASKTECDRPGRVLVVEDDESAATFVTRVLERAGFEPSWAIDADEASIMLEAGHFDVLLTDFRLPGRSGLEVVREARSARPGLGIAMMTSFNEGGLEQSARSNGADDFLEKPLTPAALASRVTSLCTRPRDDGSYEKGAGAPPEPSGSGPGAAEDPTVLVALELPDPFEAAKRAVATPPRTEREGGGPAGAVLAGPTGHAGVVPLWASSVPVVSHLTSGAGPVGAPHTSSAWTFAR